MNKVEKEHLEKVRTDVKRAVRAARSGREAVQAISRAGIPVTDVTAVPQGGYRMRIWFKMAGDDTLQDILCPCGAE